MPPRRGEPSAVERLRATSAPATLAGAQLAIAREYGFASWARLKREVERREILDARDVDRLRTLLAAEPELARDHDGALVRPSEGRLTARLRRDAALRHGRGAWRDLEGTGAVAQGAARGGAPVDGEPGDRETPLITAASYGDAEVARVLIEAGADIEATRHR